MKDSKENKVADGFNLISEEIIRLRQENAELKEKYSNLQLNTEIRIKGCNDEIYRLQAQIEKMKNDIKDVADMQVYVSRATLNILLNQWEKKNDSNND